MSQSSWIVRCPAGTENFLVVGEPHTHWNWVENLTLHAAASSFPDLSVQKTWVKLTARGISLQTFPLCFTSQVPTPSPLKTQRVQTQAHGGNHSEYAPRVVFSWATLASIQWAKPETKTPTMTLPLAISNRSRHCRPKRHSNRFLLLFRCLHSHLGAPSSLCCSFLSVLLTSTPAYLQPHSTYLPEWSFFICTTLPFIEEKKALRIYTRICTFMQKEI